MALTISAHPENLQAGVTGCRSDAESAILWVAASFTSEAVAVLADDRGVRLSTATSLAT